VTIGAIKRIWERVLRCRSIGTDDNFFDIGGTNSLANLLLSELTLLSGRELPVTMISSAPTISAQTCLLEQCILPPPLPFIQMKRGSQKPPVFVLHGLGGIAECYGVARRVKTDHALYGSLARGIDGSQEPHESVEDMAEFYLSALETIEPCGPYLLIGYSFGGLVALEMAQRLSAKARDVAFLVLLDTYPSERAFSGAQRSRLIAQRMKFHINGMRRSPAGAAGYLVDKLRAKRELSRADKNSENALSSCELFPTQACQRVEQKARVAMAHYRPRFYQRKIRFLAAKTSSFFLPSDPISVWRNLSSDFELETIPCDHSEMIEANRDHLASILTRYIQEATLDCARAK
jgi:aspartate racemase